jgi:hypothetical protein
VQDGGGTTFYPHSGGRSSSSGGAKGTKQAKGKEGAGGKGKKEKISTLVKNGDAPAPATVSATQKITVEAKAGRVLFHWHGVSGGGCMLHEGDEVKKGDKWVLRTDIMG